MSTLRIAINKGLYGIVQNLVAWIDGDQVGGAGITLYPSPRMQVSAYDETREILFDVENVPADLWQTAELTLRLMLSTALVDREAA